MGQTAEELRAQLEDQRNALTRDVTAVGDRVSPGRIADRQKAKARQSVTNLKDRVMGGVDSTRSNAGHLASNVGSTMGGAMETTRATATGAVETATSSVASMPDATMTRTQGSPLLTGAIAFGAGALLAMMLPTTSAEAELVDQYGDQVRDTVDSLKSAAAGAASEATDHLSGPVKDMVGDLAGKAQSAVQDVTASAQDAKSAVTEKASDATSQVKDSVS